ncbi:hypothetical protein Tco_0085462 [Tanacetum coccineum]
MRRDQGAKTCHFPDSPRSSSITFSSNTTLSQTSSFKHKSIISKDDGIVCRLKFVRIGEDYHEYGLSIPKTMRTEAIKQFESYQMFIKYSTGQILPKKSRGKVKRKTSSKRRVKKKVTLSADDNIIFDDPDTALELGKSISKTEAEEAEAARQVHATHARIMTEYVPEPTKRRKLGKVTSDPPKNLKGTRGSSKGTGTKPGVPNESTVVSATSSEGNSTKPGKDDKEGDVDDKNDETESDEDDIYKYKIHGRKDEDEEMINGEVDDSDKGNKEVTDAAKADAEKTSEVKDDPKKTELPSTSFSLFVSLGFGNQFLKLSFDSSLVSTVKDTTDAEINSLLEVKIQSEVLHTKSPSILSVPVSVISEPTVPTPLRVAKLEKDVSDLKKIDLSVEALVALKTQVPSVVALIEDENAMDKGVADTIQDHKRKHDDDEDDDDEDPLAGPNQGKAPSKGSKTGKSALAKEPVEEPIAEVVMDDVDNDVVYDDDQPQDDSEPKTTKTPNLNWFKQPLRPPTLDPEWNKRQVVLDQPEHPWFNQMVSATKDPLIFDDLMATLIDFSNIELEYHFQECFNALTDRLDCNNSEGDRYPFDLSKPFPLQSHPGHLTVATDYFFNNDLEYLKSSDPKMTYTTSIMKTKAARYEIEGIEDMLNKFSKHNVYSTKKILGVKSVSVKKLHGYGHLEEIVVKRADRQFYKFKEGDFVDLHLNDIEDMLLLAVQHKLFHLTDSDIVDFIVALRMFTRSLVIKKRVEDLQLGVESYQKKLNITPPQQTFLEIEFKELYTPSHKPPGVIYEDLTKQKRVMRADELYKFSDGTLKKVRDELHHRIRDFCLEYNKEMPRRKWTAIDRKRSELMVELIDKQMRERRIIRNLERLVGARELEMDYKLMTLMRTASAAVKPCQGDSWEFYLITGSMIHGEP